MFPEKSSQLSAIWMLRFLFGAERDGHFLVRLSGLFSLLIGLLIFSLWIFTPLTLETDFPSAAQVSPLTALGLMIIGFNIRLLRWEAIRVNAARIARLFRVGMLAIGVVGLAHHAGMLSVGLVRIGGLEGRALLMPSPITALCFVLFGATFVLINRHRATWLAHSLSLAAAALSLTSGIAIIYATPADFPQWGMLFTEGPALPILFAISLTLLSASAYRGWTAVIVSDTDGGVMARRLLPASILVPVAIGWLRLLAKREGWINDGIGLTLHVLLSVFAMAFIVWWNAGMLVRAALRGRQAATNNQDLESAYREILKKSREVIFAFNSDGLFTFLNPAAEVMFGVSAIPVVPLHVREVLGEAAWDILGPAFVGSRGTEFRRVPFQTGSPAPRDFDLSTVVLFRSENPIELLVIAKLAAAPMDAGDVDRLLIAVELARDRYRQTLTDAR